MKTISLDFNKRKNTWKYTIEYFVVDIALLQEAPAMLPNIKLGSAHEILMHLKIV